MEAFNSKEPSAVFLCTIQQKRSMANLSTYSGLPNVMERWIAWQCFFPSIPYSLLVPAGVFRIALCKSSSFTQSLKLGQYLDSPKACGSQLCHGSSTVSQSSEIMFVSLLNRRGRGGKEETTETRSRYCRSQRTRESNSRAWGIAKKVGQGRGWEDEGQKGRERRRHSSSWSTQSWKLMLPWASKRGKKTPTKKAIKHTTL